VAENEARLKEEELEMMLQMSARGALNPDGDYQYVQVDDGSVFGNDRLHSEGLTPIRQSEHLDNYE
jgi:hypothetical protein